jgi:hypothetical protein
LFSDGALLMKNGIRSKFYLISLAKLSWLFK